MQWWWPGAFCRCQWSTSQLTPKQVQAHTVLHVQVTYRPMLGSEHPLATGCTQQLLWQTSLQHLPLGTGNSIIFVAFPLSNSAVASHVSILFLIRKSYNSSNDWKRGTSLHGWDLFSMLQENPSQLHPWMPEWVPIIVRDSRFTIYLLCSYSILFKRLSY